MEAPTGSRESSPDAQAAEPRASHAPSDDRARRSGAETAPNWALSLGQLLGEFPDGVYAYDAGQLRPLNRAALDMLGYRREEEFERNPVHLARALEVRDGRTREPLSLAAPVPPAAAGVRELIIRHRETGEERFLRCALGPVIIAGAVVGAIAVGSDMTARAAVEADAHRRAEFEQQLIGIVSHDLRNPLQVVRFAASLGRRAAGVDARAVRQFERILSSSARALRMIDDLLDFTRIRFMGALSVEARPIELSALAQRVVEEVLTTHPGRHVEVETAGDVSGQWDPDRLEQVVQNLVSNALQHTTEGTPVRVRARAEAERAVLEVHNGGPGIPCEDQARLFEPFQRGKGKPRSGRSMGLGLHITRHIVQAHGGTLELHSSDEHGTTFTVRLPRGEVPDQT